MSENSSKPPVLERFVPALLVLTIVLAFFVGILWQKVSYIEKGGTLPSQFDGQGEAEPALEGKLSDEAAARLAKYEEGDHILGSKDAEIFVIEYSDLECPFCASFHPTLEQIVEEYDGKVAWVYRHFPLVTIHPRANPAAYAAECVNELGGANAFWKFIANVFENQATALSDEGLRSAAVNSGVGSAAFSACFSSDKYNEKVAEQARGGEVAGVTGTPANFVVNKKGGVWLVPGALPYESIKSTIEEALAD